jgi:outer membrane receptor for monomeric catechols
MVITKGLIFSSIYSDLHYTIVMAVRLTHVQSLVGWRGSSQLPKTSEKPLSRQTMYHVYNKSVQSGATAYNYKIVRITDLHRQGYKQNFSVRLFHLQSWKINRHVPLKINTQNPQFGEK